MGIAFSKECSGGREGKGGSDAHVWVKNLSKTITVIEFDLRNVIQIYP